MADPVNQITVTAQNQATDWIRAGQDKRMSIFITGDLSGTITLQAKKPEHTEADNPTFITDVEEHTTNVLRNTDQVVGTFDFRLICKTGDYTSGTAFIEINVK